MSLKFLNLKSFHPTNKANQKRLFIAEERAKSDKKREEERSKQVIEEQEFIKNRTILTGSKLEGERSKVGFLYAPPPGVELPNKDNKEKKDGTGSTEVGGDGKEKNYKEMTDVEKFPFLANAPVQGSYTSDIKVKHKPFGIELKDVRCLRCHQWGHYSGDRSCPLVNENPSDSKRLEREDPMLAMQLQEQNHVEHGGDGSTRVDQDSDDDDDDEDVEREFLASLTKRQRKLLLKQIRKEEKKKKRKEKREKKDKMKKKMKKEKTKEKKKEMKQAWKREKERLKYGSNGKSDGDVSSGGDVINHRSGNNKED